MKTRKKILLTGASGTIGYEVLKQFFQKRNTIDLTVFDVKTKTSAAKFDPYKKGVEIIYGDITNEDDLLKVCSSKDLVIHLAAIIPPLADDKPELYFKVNALGTENLVRNLERYSPRTFLLYSSSVSVYGDRISNPWIKVGDPLNPSPGDEYAKAKIKAEEIIQKSKLDWSIFRLGAIMGGHKISKLMFHQPLDTSFEIATPEDTARAFAEKNFHCGYYRDGDELENILHFRNDTLESFFDKEKRKISSLKRFVFYVFRKQIKKNLRKESEPWKAYKTNNKEMIHRFFNDSVQFAN